MSFQKVVKPTDFQATETISFRTVSFQKVVKLQVRFKFFGICFRTVSFQKVVKRKNYTGTKNWRGGLTTVAEKGQEIIKPPSSKPFLAQSEMMLNLPSGTEILNNAETQKELTTQPKSNKLSNSVNTSTSTTSVSTSTTSTNNKTSANNISISQVFNVYETGKDSIDKLKCFRTVSFQKVVKLCRCHFLPLLCFRTVSFQKVVKQ